MIIKTNEWTSIRGACELVGKTSATIYNWINEGLIKTESIGDKDFYLKEDLIKTMKLKENNRRFGKNES